MKVSYDAGEDVLYVALGDENTVTHSVDIGRESDGVSADLDAEGHLIAIEILGARARYGEERLRTISVEVPTLVGA